MEDVRLTKRERRELAREEKAKLREKRAILSRIKKLLIIAIPVLFIVWFGYKAYQYIIKPQPEVASVSIEVSDTDWVKGNRESKATLLEFGDFQCPACVSYYPLVKRLLEEVPQEMKVVYRHFPLTQIHKNALPAAKASEAAGRQDKFWEMHNILFEKNDDWANLGDPKDKFIEFAKEIGLDEQKFQEDFDSKEVDDAINADVYSANQLGVNSTPTFYLNGRKIQPKSYEEFKDLVEDTNRGYSLE